MFPPNEHKPLSGSKLSRIIACPGSFQLAQRFESEQSEYAAEGSMLHAVVEAYLNNLLATSPSRYEMLSACLIPAVPPIFISEVGDIELTHEQINTVEDCIEYLGTCLRVSGEFWSLEIEKQTTMSKYHASLFESGGTCDVILVDNEHKVLHIIDWKFGQGVYVDVSNNDQLLSYAAGALLDVGLMADDTWQITCHVVQPRLDNYSQATYTTANIRAWLDGRVLPAVKEAYSQHPSFNPGKEQCRWCPAKYTCRHRQVRAQQTAAEVFGAFQKMPDDLSFEELSQVLEEAPAYEDYIKDLREYAYRLISSGKEVPGWKLVAGRSIRRWGDEQKTIEFLMEHIDIDDMFTRKLVSPSQVEKLNKSLKKSEEFQALVVKPEGTPTLAKESDRRPALEFKTFAEHCMEIENGNS